MRWLLPFLALSFLLIAGCVAPNPQTGSATPTPVLVTTTPALSPTIATSSPTARPTPTAAITPPPLSVNNSRREGKRYDEVSGLKVLDEKVVYAALQKGAKADNEVLFVVVDGVESKAYAGISGLTSIGGKLAYMASDGKEWFLVWNGVEGKRYTFAGELADIGGEPAYIAKEGGEMFTGGKHFLVRGGSEGKRYDGAFGLVNVNGKPAYAAMDIAENKVFVVFDDKEIKKYDAAMNPVNIGGKLAYVAAWQKPNQSAQEFVVLDGEESKLYKQVGKLTDDKLTAVGGKPAYSVQTDNGNFTIWGSESEFKFPLKGEALIEVVDVGGRPALHVGKRNEKPSSMFVRSNNESIVFDGKRGKTYDQIWGIMSIGGQSVYNARDKGGDFVVRGNAEGKRYGYTSNPVDVGGRLVYLAAVKGKLAEGFMVIDGKEKRAQVEVMDELVAVGKDHVAFIARERDASDGSYKMFVVETGIDSK